MMLRSAFLEVRTACIAFLGRGVKNLVKRRGVIGGGFFVREAAFELSLLSSAMANSARLTTEVFSGVPSMAAIMTRAVLPVVHEVSRTARLSSNSVTLSKWLDDSRLLQVRKRRMMTCQGKLLMPEALIACRGRVALKLDPKRDRP